MEEANVLFNTHSICVTTSILNRCVQRHMLYLININYTLKINSTLKIDTLHLKSYPTGKDDMKIHKKKNEDKKMCVKIISNEVHIIRVERRQK